jgi:hypothetical protein
MDLAHEQLMQMLTRLKSTAIRDQLDSLLDEAGRGELTLRDALALLCEREIGRKDQRRIDMALSIAKFPFLRDLIGFDFKAQPSLDAKQIRELATGRFIANGEASTGVNSSCRQGVSSGCRLTPASGPVYRSSNGIGRNRQSAPSEDDRFRPILLNNSFSEAARKVTGP